MTKANQIKKQISISPERLTELCRATLIASAGASTRLGGSKLSDNEVEQVVNIIFRYKAIFAKSVSFGASAPSGFVAKRRGFLPVRPVAAHCAATLSEREVSLCGNILTFARTYFTKNP